MELIDFKALHDYESSDIKSFVGLQLERMIACGKITSSERLNVSEEELAIFLNSPLGRRMAVSCADGKLHRETPFVLRVSADVIDPDYPGDETVLVQGIIDAWFEEDGEIVLLDYKTDRVDPETDPEGSVLVSHYLVQLSLYREALERLTEKRVRETWIYSFALGREVMIP